jgi:CubicO group peptidase (beta-lactamase class C family)
MPRHPGEEFMSLKKFAAVSAAALAIASQSAAQEKVVSERTLTTKTGWSQYHNISAEQLSGFIERDNARIIDLDVNDASPLRFSATLVANSGPHASGWWWYYGLTEAQVNAKLAENTARLIDVDPYMVDGALRFAVVMKPNTGPDATGWWWYYGQTPATLSAKLDEKKARLIDLERYKDRGETRFAAIMVSNLGPKATGWWWYHGQTAAEVTQRINTHKARLLDVERHGAGANQRFDIVLVPNTGPSAIGWWWYFGVSAQDLLEMARRHGARLVDIEPPKDGASTYAGFMIDNGMVKNGDCGGAFAGVDKRIVDWMKSQEIPGASAAIVKGDKLVYACAFGYADLKTGREVKPKDLFRIASIAKPVTSSAIRKLEADGKLARSDKTLDRLGAFKPDEPYKDDRLDDITIQHLLDHKGGWNWKKMGFDPMFYTDQVATALGTARPSTCTQNIRYMFQNIDLSFAPGGGIDDKDYSNFGYCILGRIVHARSGQTYESYVQQKVLDPIRITDMKIGKSRASGRFPNEVQYYDKPFAKDVTSVFDGDPQKVQQPDGGFHLEAMDAHGGWIASALDIARFARFADPAPYGGGNWSHQGGLNGTSTIVSRSGDVVISIFFNAANTADATAFSKLAKDSTDSVSSWPSTDLWGKYGYGPRRTKQ